MRRALVLILLALATFVAAASPAGAAKPRHEAFFELHADGFLVQVESRLGSDTVRLLLDRHGEVAYYFVHGQVDGESVRARFGGLGSVDVRFVPGRGEGRLGCAKQEEGWQQGSFVGSIVFHGEHDYADIDAHRARGGLRTYPSKCGADKGSKAVAARADAGSGVPETGAVLWATTGASFPALVFECYTESGTEGNRVFFSGLREEKRGGMEVIRGVQVRGGAATFQWDLGTGTATVEPPGPITGRAFYRREGHGKASWRGDLSFPVLGATRPMRLTGAALTAHLGPAR